MSYDKRFIPKQEKDFIVASRSLEQELTEMDRRKQHHFT